MPILSVFLLIQNKKRKNGIQNLLDLPQIIKIQESNLSIYP